MYFFRRDHLKSELLVHTHEIKTIPCFHDLSILKLHISHPGKLNFLSAGISSMYSAAGRFIIILGNNIFHFNMDLRELLPETAVKSFESFGARGIDAFNSMNNSSVIQHFINGGFTALVPYLLHPAQGEC